MFFAPGTITAKKSGFRGRALALARPNIRRTPQVRRRLQAAPNLLHSLASRPLMVCRYRSLARLRRQRRASAWHSELQYRA
jgi:hypothetical protein